MLNEKKVVIVSLLLLILSVCVGKSYIDSKVRADIYDNTKKYNELLIKAVNNFKENGTVDWVIFNDVYHFYNKYTQPIKITKKEAELISLLRDEMSYYGHMMYGQSLGYRDFNIELSIFENASIKITSYFKNNIH